MWKKYKCLYIYTVYVYNSRMLFELFPKAVMSVGFSLVLKKASYFELSCVTFQAVRCLVWLNPVSAMYLTLG